MSDSGRTVWHGGRPYVIRGNTVEYGYLGADFEAAVNEGFTGEPAARSPIDEGVLQVEKVDFQVAVNAKMHRTGDFDITEGPDPQLVVRRGQVFDIQIVFNQDYTKDDDLRLVFEIGDQPAASKGTLVELLLSDEDKKDQWGAISLGPYDKLLKVYVVTPPDCIVGKWRFKLHVVKKADNKTSVFRYNHKDPVYMLFNPWNKADAVFMEGDEAREAYVLQESGRQYVGNYWRWTARPWAYGQFSGHVLDCCMYLLDSSSLGWKMRGNPVQITRNLSAMVNSPDDKGVLWGRWDGNYGDGKTPSAWTGSAPILEQYYSTKSTVKYGQCWVFSGVLTTVCRALGIPTRSVTNFQSAHDEDASVTIDFHFDEKGDSVGYLDDSVWNFHVWNEAWMARPGLPEGYGGWQAFDSTPQERSAGVYQCGPCPVRAIKEGEINTPYDAPFIFAEVNADRIHWTKKEEGNFERTAIFTDRIGKLISTLAVGEDKRSDLTQWYKYPEGSAEERIAVMKAVRTASEDPAPMSKDVDFQLTFDAKNSWVGSDFLVDLHMKNRSSKDPRTVNGIFSVSTMYYTGVVTNLLGSLRISDQEIKADDDKRMTITVPASIYLSKLEDCCMLSLYVMVRVKETNQIFTEKDTARLRKPHLVIKGPGAAKKDVEFELEISFTNPLDRTLTDCSLEVEGPGVTSAKTYPQGDVAAKAAFSTTIKLKPRKLGKREIVVVFHSLQLHDINGFHALIVE